MFAAKEPYILFQDDKDSGDNPNSPYSLMIGEQLYCQVPKSDNPLGHCLIQLVALYYIYHLEYPQRFRNVYFYLQQFLLGDHELLCAPRVINSYHESIQPYLIFANSLWVEYSSIRGSESLLKKVDYSIHLFSLVLRVHQCHTANSVLRLASKATSCSKFFI